SVIRCVCAGRFAGLVDLSLSRTVVMLTRRTLLRAAVAAAAAGTVSACVPAGRSAKRTVKRTLPFERIAYGGDAQQYGELRRPTSGGVSPVVVVVHGGFWLSQYDLGLIGPGFGGGTPEGLRDWELRDPRTGRP